MKTQSNNFICPNCQKSMILSAYFDNKIYFCISKFCLGFQTADISDGLCNPGLFWQGSSKNIINSSSFDECCNKFKLLKAFL